MSALAHKLWRDLWRLRLQGLTIALLLACGIGSLVASAGAYESLREARDHFYEAARLPDLFVRLNRAPLTVLGRVRDVPGVVAASGRLTGDYRIELGATTDTLSARFVSLPAHDSGGLDEVTVVRGRSVAPGASDEVLLGEALAEFWGLEPGATLTAVIEGRRVELRAVGFATSPEQTVVVPRAGLLNPGRFGVAWMDRQALGQAMGMAGETNDVELELAPGADRDDVMRRVDALLEPYGGQGAAGREEQPSVRLVGQKIDQQRAQAVVTPAIFLSIAAFLLHILLSRVVGTQREQIATMKALGYRTRELLVHYLSLALVVGLAGVALGLVLGVVFGRLMMGVYAHYFKFPVFAFRIDWRAVLVGTLVALCASVTGAILPVRRAVSVPPAEAMHPEPPARFQPTFLERLGLHRLLPPALRMVLRDVERRPVRLALSVASVALATSTVVVGAVCVDSIDETLRLQYEVSHREDLTVTFARARPWQATRELGHVPGVLRVEGERTLSVRLRSGPRSRTTALLGLSHSSDLHVLLGADMAPLQPPATGLSLSRVLGDELAVAPGDEVDVEVLEGSRPRLRLPVTAPVDDLMGLWGYVDREALDRLLGEAPTGNVALVAVDHAALDDVLRRIEALPEVASVSRPEADRHLMQAQVGDVYVALEVMLSLFASAIVVGVVYNNARIGLEVRSRDLATLRILGFTRGELAVVLFGEQAVHVGLGLWPGVALGFWMGAKVTASIDRELLRVPPTLSASAQVTAVCTVLLAALLSALAVQRRADRLDLVAVLKARD